MKKEKKHIAHRRAFLKASAGLFAGLSLIPPFGTGKELFTPDHSIHIIGPVSGYSPQLGTLVSMLNWMQHSLLSVVQGLTQADLDYLHDNKANTIGALLMHIAAIEVIYQDMTFYGLKDFSERNKKKWSAAMHLGDTARKEIKGKDLAYYLSQMAEVRQKTLVEFKARDDQWLAAVDPSFFDNQATNNYCKWFHVCEHIANHRGQITWITKRLPASKAGRD